MSNPRIAVAYLATPGGDDAVAVGEQIARTLGAEIDLCMVLPRDRSALATTPGGILQREAESWLAAAAAGVPSDLKVTTHLSFDESSTAGLIGYGYVSAYCAAKHGVIGLTRSLALETAQKGVTVNAVCPGYTETDIVRGAVANIVEKTGMTPDAARAKLALATIEGLKSDGK